MLAPVASGVASVTVPADIVELNPPPLGCEGGCSSVVPCTVTEHGAASGGVFAAHVAGSLMVAMTTAVEVIGRMSAMPDGAGNVVRSKTRKRRRETGAPVLFVIRRRKERVPKVELFAGTQGGTTGFGGAQNAPPSRSRLGASFFESVVSISVPLIATSCEMGDERFSGPGAPS